VIGTCEQCVVSAATIVTRVLRKATRLGGCIVAAGLLLLGAASPAAAAPTIGLTVAANPVESITTQLGATGTAEDANDALDVTVKPAGGQGCAANFAADASGGSSIVVDEKLLGTGPYSEAVNWTFDTAGSYLLCGWLNDGSQSGDPVVASESLTVVVRQPHLALSISAPGAVTPRQTFELVTTAQAEAKRDVEEYIEPSTGRGCPANAQAADSFSGELRTAWPDRGTEWFVDGGPFTETANEELSDVGNYLVCAYAEYPTNASPPEASASAPISVLAPPAPCVVPRLGSRTRLNAAEQKVRAGSCTVGRIRDTASRTVPLGDVVSLSPASGTERSAGTPVIITVSTGPPCVVPQVGFDVTLKTTEHRVTAAHCLVGKVSYSPSTTRRRGTVIRLSTRSGTQLPSHAAVNVFVSAGRPKAQHR